MIASRNRRAFRGAVCVVGLMIAGALGLAATAAAQGTGPVKLTAPKKLNPRDGTPQGASGTAVPTSIFGYKSGPNRRSITARPSVGSAGIQVDQLRAVEPDSAGTLTAKTGGFGVDMWAGSQRAYVMRLLRALPSYTGSATIRDGLRRALLSAASVPQGLQSGAKAGPSLAAARLRALIVLGDYAGASDLLTVMPRQGRGPALLRVEAELNFLTKDHTSACGLVGDQVQSNAGDFWQKALIFCQILAGQADKAELGLTLMRETGLEDQLFLALATNLINGDPVSIENFGKPSVLHLTLMGAAKFVLPAGAGQRRSGVLRYLAISPHISAEQRINAIELAVGQELFGEVLLNRLYSKIDMEKAADSDIAQMAVERAKLYRAAMGAKVPTAKAEAASRALESGRQLKRFGAVARIFGPMLKNIPPSHDLLWFAPIAFRALAINGEDDVARAWLDLARRNAAISEEAGKLLREMAPLIQLFDDALSGGEALPASATWDTDQAVLYYGLAEALGKDVPEHRWEPLVLNAAKTQPMPDPALWIRLVRLNQSTVAVEAPPAQTVSASAVLARGSLAPVAATTISAAPGRGPATKASGSVVMSEALPPPTPGAASGETRVGERLLLIALAMGDKDLDDVNPVVVAEVVRGLRRIGLGAAARKLAMEAAINAGL